MDGKHCFFTGKRLFYRVPDMDICVVCKSYCGRLADISPRKAEKTGFMRIFQTFAPYILNVRRLGIELVFLGMSLLFLKRKKVHLSEGGAEADGMWNNSTAL